MFARLIRTLVVAAAVAGFVAGCASPPPKPDTMRDPSVNFSNFKTFGWTASGELLGVSSRKGDNGSVSGYGVANLSVSSAPAARFGQFSLSIYNLGDKKYDDPTSSYMLHESIEQSGRQFRLRWTLPL